MRTNLHSSLEVLEDRIAPAGLISSIHANSIKYTDTAGALVTVSFTKNFITSANANTLFTLVANPSGTGAILESINLNLYSAPTKLAGTGISIKAKTGLVDVGLIDATGIALGSVKVVGDLGAIDAGSSPTKTAVSALTLDSFGAAGLTTQAAGGSLVSNLDGNLPKLTVSGNVDGESINVAGGVTTVAITGNLDGSTQPGVSGAGSIMAEGSIRSVAITGNLVGNSASGSGEILAGANITKGVTIGGNLDGSLGSAGNSGYILAGGSVGTISIGGNVIGGGGEYSGAIRSGTSLGTVKIGGSIEGGTALFSGAIESGNKLAGLTVGKDITAGATVRASSEIPTLVVKGSIVGTAAAPVTISAEGVVDTRAKTDIAIGALTVTQDMTYAVVLAGYDTSLDPQDPNAQIGAVSVGGDFTASDLVAGVQGTMNGGSFVFGTAADAEISTGIVGISSTILSKIASVTIGGTVAGDSVLGANYGITAEYIASVKVGSTVEPLLAGPNNDLFSTSHEIALASNVTIDEVPA